MPKELSPIEAATLVRQGALMVDIREPSEREAGIIPGAAYAPLSALASARIDVSPDRAVIFHCKAGGRTKMNASALKRKAGPSKAYLLKGGIDAWANAGLPMGRP